MQDLATFDETKIDWGILEGIDHAWLSIMAVDDEAKIIDVLFKFAAGKQIVLHRHVAAFHTFVVRGEHRIYTPEGELTEVRPAGTYRASPASEEPHKEGGGDDDVVVLFSLRPYSNGVIYQVLNEDGEIASEMTFDDMKEIFEAA
jgi:hypothetical protein